MNSVTFQGITLELLKFSVLYATVLTASGVNPNGFQQPATGERKVLRRKADVADRNLQLTLQHRLMGGFSVYASWCAEECASMPHLNPYVHSCVEHPTLSCPACKWVEERRTVDVLVCDEGTLWPFNPLSERAKAWVADVADILIP